MGIFRQLILPITGACSLMIFATDQIGSIARVEGLSMQPTLNPTRTSNDIVALSRLDNLMTPERGEIISINCPTNKKFKLIKRVKAISGDHLKLPEGKSIVVPEGHCWILGDNELHSYDSREFGPISVGLINAKAKYIIWPPNRWGRL
ncbi:hypothetical protein SNEBB_001573 [Seison nebaliae]|nr:hypothetical protein SNEBB_001573 [Seison nebaliae]